MLNGYQLNDIAFLITLSIQLLEPHDHTLSSDLAALLESAEEESLSSSSAADIVIIADEGTVRLPAMKTLLCARSAVFKAMLLSGGGGSGMSESLSKEIIIPDFDSGVLRAMLRYIHTDKTNLSELDDQNAESLYVAANKYQIKGLLIICEEHLKATMNASNASRRLLLSDTLDQVSLKKATLRFFLDHAKECVASDTFADNFGLSLCKEVMQALAGVVK
jgi:speckle-type POZ protein